MFQDDGATGTSGFTIMTNPPESVIQEHQLQLSLLKNPQVESEYPKRSRDRTRILINKNPGVPLPNPIVREKQRMDCVNARLERIKRRQERTDASPVNLDGFVPKESLCLEERRFIHEGIAQLDSVKYTTTYQSYLVPFELVPVMRPPLVMAQPVIGDQQKPQ